MDENKKVIICGTPVSWEWLRDLHQEDIDLVLGASARGKSIFSMECVVMKTDEEMEEIRKQEEKRAQDQFKKMLSKPRRKR